MRMVAYIEFVAVALQSSSRWELYRVLSDPTRLRLLFLADVEELTIGELGVLIDESQSKISRHVAVLKRAGLLSVRRQGTRSFVRLVSGKKDDPVVQDGLVTGRSLAEEDGNLSRVAQILRDREAPSKAYFEEGKESSSDSSLPQEMPAYLGLLSRLLPRRGLAIDVGTGDGSMLELWGPVFDRVVALDRSEAQLALAKRRVVRRGYENVELRCAEADEPSLLQELSGTADVVSASRVLHHAARPGSAVSTLAKYLAPGGRLVIIDYSPHDDEVMREKQADLWLGFAPDELSSFAKAAGLVDAEILSIPRERRGTGPDSHLPWQALVARRVE